MKRLHAASIALLLCLVSVVSAVSKDDVPALIKQLQDADPIVRLKAAKTLGTLGADAQDALFALTAASSDADEDVAPAAKRAIAKIREAMSDSDKDATRTQLASLMKEAKSNDADTREKAVVGLAKLLRNDDDVIRLQAARALGEVGLAARPVMRLLDAAAKDTAAGVRKEARKALERIQEAMDGEAKTETQQKVAPLLESLKDKSPATRQKAPEALASSEASADDITEPILALFVDKSPAVRQAAMDAVEKVNPTIHKRILTIMVDRSVRNKEVAITELGDMGVAAKPVVPTLLRLYHNQNGEYGALLLTALNSIDPENKDFQSLVIAEMVHSQTAEERRWGRADVRHKALQIAGELIKGNNIEPAKLMKPLRATLSTLYKLDAINLLGEIGPEAEDALPELRQLKLDPVERVRDAATEAVNKIEQRTEPDTTPPKPSGRRKKK